MTRNQGGFSLIEAIIVIVLLGAGMATILSMLAGGSREVGLNSSTQIAARYVQERIEQIIADRRNTAQGYGYARIVIGPNYPATEALPTTPPLTRRIAMNTLPPGTQGCPATAAGQCRRVDVWVTTIPAAPATPVTLAAASLMVTNY
jgi:type II secretory pathway pseudopilin PulG